MLPDVQAHNGNSLHIGNALQNISWISHMAPSRYHVYTVTILFIRSCAPAMTEQKVKLPLQVLYIQMPDDVGWLTRHTMLSGEQRS